MADPKDTSTQAQQLKELLESLKEGKAGVVNTLEAGMLQGKREHAGIA